VAFASLALLLCAGAQAGDYQFSGQVQGVLIDQQTATNGPMAQAVSLNPDIAPLPASGAWVETQLRLIGNGLTATGTLWQQREEGQPWTHREWVNELYISHGIGDWQFAVGKKIVGWDVGYAFRPNDMVQQETRRTLVTNTIEGRPMLMAERFDADTAWSIVLVNPTHPREDRGAEEPALAFRVYRRNGPLDLYGFARYGARTNGSVGTAAAWVASDAVELHASLRYFAEADTVAIDPADSGVVKTNPWGNASTSHGAQALIGGTWTSEYQLSVIAEAWWDGSAMSNAQWDAWTARNMQLVDLIGSPVPSGAIAANLIWQTDAFGASSNLRRTNLFVQASWTIDKWQPTLDVLYTPADAGRIVTASLIWQGDTVRLAAGLRFYGGPPDAILAQVPTRRIGYLSATWAF
jgi:hypothetical protein